LEAWFWFGGPALGLCCSCFGFRCCFFCLPPLDWPLPRELDLVSRDRFNS
jgi:hypothetical protein